MSRSSTSSSGESTAVGDSSSATADSETTDAPTTDASAEESDSDSQSETGEPTGPCLPGVLELGDVVFDMTMHRVMGEDLAAEFDPDQGSFACVQVVGNEVSLQVLYGPFDFDGLQSSLYLRASATGLYDLATDAGVPGSGEDGAIELSYAYDFEPASTASYGTDNQAATGSVDVIAIPTEGATFEFAAQGEIAGSDGWQFDLTFVGTVVR